MNNLVIKTHDFEEAKNKIKLFAETEINTLQVRTLEEKGWLFNKNVTASEHNEAMKDIQKFAIDNNARDLKTIKEFANVYNALEALDKDYIQGIIAGVKAAEKAGQQATETSTEAKNSAMNFEKILTEQKQTINDLVKFKEEVLRDVQDFRGQLLNKVKIAYVATGIFGAITSAHIILRILGII